MTDWIEEKKRSEVDREDCMRVERCVDEGGRVRIIQIILSDGAQ